MIHFGEFNFPGGQRRRQQVPESFLLPESGRDGLDSVTSIAMLHLGPESRDDPQSLAFSRRHSAAFVVLVTAFLALATIRLEAQSSKPVAYRNTNASVAYTGS